MKQIKKYFLSIFTGLMAFGLMCLIVNFAYNLNNQQQQDSLAEEKIDSLAKKLGYQWIEIDQSLCGYGSDYTLDCYATGYTNDPLLIEYFSELDCLRNYNINLVAKRCREIEKVR